MKQGWEIKKLGEVCDIINGRNQKKVENPNGKYPIYGSGGIMGYADDFLCRAGTTIIGRKGSINKPLYVDADFWNVDTAFGIQPKCCVDRFIYYLCKSIDFTLYDKGVTIPSLVKSDLLQIPIPVPDMAEQERIVGELDCLSGIIAAKRAQLRELDTLAQSIFYTMFGDPITNDKGWQTKKWESVYETKLGKMLDAKKQNDNDIVCPYIANVNVKWGRFDLENLKTMTFSLKEIELYKLQKGDLLICEGGEAGRCAIWDKSDSNILYQKAIHRSRVKNQDINSYYTLYFLYNFRKHGGLKDYLSKSTIEHLTREKLNTLRLPIPPIALQNEFAKKIEQIETQKLLIKQSIINLEQLFNSRMYYYFE